MTPWNPFRNKRRRGATRRPVSGATRLAPNAAPAKKAPAAKPTGGKANVVSHFLQQHGQAARGALHRLRRTPWSTALTMAVIGIALALPAGLYVLIDNARHVSGGWDNTARISVFLKQDVSEPRGRTLAEQWRVKKTIRDVRYISPDEALAEFRRLSGFDDALNALAENPLPIVLVITPETGQNDLDSAKDLLDTLQGLPEVELAQMDLAWLQRLYAIMDVAERAIAFLAAALLAGVLIIVGNTIRLMSQSYRDEIEITRLLGATDAFVRRPFLYSGLMYGLAGGLIAWLLVNLTLWGLNDAVMRLAALYQSDFALSGLRGDVTFTLLGTGALLGLLGSWLAVTRFLRNLT